MVKTLKGAKKCPFCKGDNLSMEVLSVANPIYYVDCNNEKCMAMGPEAETRERALVRWNKRG